MDNSVIDIKSLRKNFREKEILRDLSLSVPKGSIYGLLGRNGEGKTTLIKCILGLLKPSSGQLAVLSDDPWRFSEATKENLGYVPQSDRLYPWLTVRQIIDYTASFYRRWNDRLIEKLIKEWEINLEDKVGLLSVGQAQKVSILLSLGHEPELLVFDEPVASLDPGARRQFLKTILEILSDRACTIFFSTHITSDLERIADRVAILKQGSIALSGELDTIKEEVKRLRIITQKPMAADLKLEGLINWEATAKEAIVSLRGFKPELKAYIEKNWQAKVEIEDLNLEEIFLELSR